MKREDAITKPEAAYAVLNPFYRSVCSAMLAGQGANISCKTANTTVMEFEAKRPSRLVNRSVSTVRS